MSAIDKAANELNNENGGFFVAQQEPNKKGIQIRYRGNYEALMSFFASIADCIMNDYVEQNGYTIHNDLRTVLERTMMNNDKQPNDELFNNTMAQLQELFKNAKYPDDDDSEPKQEDDAVTDLIRALRCCVDMDCKNCPRFTDEDEDGENKYTTLCSQALMMEAAIKLQDITEGMD